LRLALPRLVTVRVLSQSDRQAEEGRDTLLLWRMRLIRVFFHVGFKTPAEAIEGQYVDKKCPFTSDVSIRGRIFK